ncbi:hypothetical protein E3N88_12633 [Mikania micrantha]|uniref:Integrase catalytic domain-containing protein n=1 Tax=Mikania micrantha TaxID=192012 RepID=A0A5N6P849_9ASTR|nr:hypothetical protein E3N88_12633 [Mikania micrantha]
MAVATTSAKESNLMSLQCPVLTAQNYTTWAIKMEAILDAQGLWDAIEPPVGGVADEKKSKLARAFLFQAIPEDVLLQVSKKKTAQEVWESLKMRYLGAERVQKARLHTLRSEFEALRMKDGETIDEYTGKLSGMISKHSSLGETLGDSKLVRKLFDTVPDKFIPLVASIEQYSDLDSMPFEEAIGRLKAYEDRLKVRQGSVGTENSLLLSKGDGKQEHRYSGRGSSSRGRGRWSNNERGGRSGSRGRGNGRGRGGRWNANTHQSHEYGSFGRKPKDKKNVKCYNCENYGHYAPECDQPKKQDQEVNLVQGHEEEPTLLLSILGEEEPSMVLLNEEKVFPAKYTDNDGKEDVWYLDNGASNHMTGNIGMFADLNTDVGGNVRFGDESTVGIKGKGTVLFDCKTGDQFALTNVYYIPALKNNVISLGQLTEGGYEAVMKDNYLRLFDETERLVMKVQRSSNRLYKIALTIGKQVCLAMKLDEDAWVWHARLGHTNFGVLEEMSKRKLVEGMPLIKHPAKICEGCLIAKQPRKSFPSVSAWRATKPLELIHADICGPITPSSMGGKRYFLLIVDDCTRYMWVYFLKTKDEACNTFKGFVTEVERQSGLKVKVLRTDRGGEFNSSVFNEFCQKTGIKRHLTAPYTPQQNGVVERRNRTVMGMTRSLLKTMQMPDPYWGEAVRHSVYLLNRTTTKALKTMTPYEAWRNKKPKLHHLRIFGCVAYAKKMVTHQTKLSDRSEILIHLGVEEGTKAYRLYNPKLKKVVIARDVEFNESMAWSWHHVSEDGPTEVAGKVDVTIQECGTDVVKENLHQHDASTSCTPQHVPHGSILFDSASIAEDGTPRDGCHGSHSKMLVDKVKSGERGKRFCMGFVDHVL